MRRTFEELVSLTSGNMEHCMDLLQCRLFCQIIDLFPIIIYLTTQKIQETM
jgi:hypothetical protein